MRKKADDSLTKVRLLETGARLFARYGFDATTTRMIAAEAGPEYCHHGLSFWK